LRDGEQLQLTPQSPLTVKTDLMGKAPLADWTLPREELKIDQTIRLLSTDTQREEALLIDPDLRSLRLSRPCSQEMRDTLPS